MLASLRPCGWRNCSGELGAVVVGADPHVEEHRFPAHIEQVDATAEELRRADAVIIITPHEAFDLDAIADGAGLRPRHPQLPQRTPRSSLAITKGMEAMNIQVDTAALLMTLCILVAGTLVVVFIVQGSAVPASIVVCASIALVGHIVMGGVLYVLGFAEISDAKQYNLSAIQLVDHWAGIAPVPRMTEGKARLDIPVGWPLFGGWPKLALRSGRQCRGDGDHTFDSCTGSERRSATRNWVWRAPGCL